MISIKQYKIVAFTHHHANLSDLGKLVIPDHVLNGETYPRLLNAFRSRFGITELMYLNTCNRVMLFFVSPQKITETEVANMMSFMHPHLDAKDLDLARNTASLYEGLEAIKHLFEVAASIDSLVVGEREILRQMREAYERCHEWNLTGDAIRLALRYTVEAAKKVYSDTRIGQKSVSVVSLAIQELLRQNLSEDTRFLIVGAGQTNTLVAKFLLKYRFKKFAVFNRTLHKATELAYKLGAKAYPLKSLNYYNEEFDVLFVCTSSAEPIITTALYEKLIGDDHRKKIIIDLSVPQNVSREVIEEYNVHYIEIENLKNLAQKNLLLRSQEVEKAKEIIENELTNFSLEFQSRQMVKVLTDEVPSQIKDIKEHAINNVFKREIANLDHTSRDLMERMMAYMEKRCISVPMTLAKKTVAD
jgi:glutamyl-tRNA reductase